MNPLSSAISYDHVVLLLLLSPRGGMQIFLKTLTDQTITPEVEIVAGRTLSDYSIKKDGILHMLLSLHGGMQLFVKTLTGDTIILSVKLVDGRTPSDYRIQKIFMQLNLRGGMQIFMLTLADRTCRTLSNYIFQKEYFQPLLSLREGMQILAKTLKSKTITQDIEASDVFRALRISPLLEDGRTLSDYILLSLRGGIQLYVKSLTGKTITSFAELADGRAHSDYSIQKEYFMTSMLSLRGGVQIFAKTLTDKTITPDAEASYVIRALHLSPILAAGCTLSDYNIQEGNRLCQAKIPNKKGILSVWQRLILTSKQFGDCHTSPGHDNQKESTLHLVLRLCGDMPIFANTLTGKTITLDALTSEPCPVIEFQTNLVPHPRIPP